MIDRPAFAAGTRASLPVLLGIAPFGMICGVAMVAGGIPPLAAVLMSVVVFAGASMLAASQLLAAGVPVALVVVTAFFINLRFMMYSASIRPHLGGLPLGWRLPVAYLLADNPYALCMARFADHPEDKGKLGFYLGATLPVWLCWQLAVVAGVLVGARLPAVWKLEFAAGATVVLAHGLPLRLGLMLAALAGIAAGVLAERKPA